MTMINKPGGSGSGRLGVWERRGEWPLSALAVAFLGAYAWPILQPHLARDLLALCRWVNVIAWVAFAVDYLVRVGLSEHKRHYVWRHLPDLAVLALPLLRPLRLLRLVMLLRVLNRGATRGLRGRIAIYVGGTTLLLMTSASLAVLDAERHNPKANIASFGDAMWWSLSTLTTVGYGDRFPLTTEGRWVAAGLMLGGVALLGTVTASIASWLIEQVRKSEEDVQAVTRADFHALVAEIALLRAQLITPPDPTHRGE